MSVIAAASAAAATVVLAGCTSQGAPRETVVETVVTTVTQAATTPAETNPAQPAAPTAAPALQREDAVHACATAVDTELFLADGTWMGDGWGKHYSADLADATIVGGEWQIVFYPTHEDMAAATCHTNGTTAVSMTRAEFEQAMGDRTYDHYVRLTPTNT